MEQQEINKVKRSINLYPVFYAFSADLILFVPIDTLFLTLVKGMNASQISAMTMISLLVCVLSQKLILKITKAIGNARAIQLGALMLLLASIILTFGKSFISMLIYRSMYELAFMFWGMLSVLLNNNLNFMNRSNEYYNIRNKAKIMYGIGTMFTALLSGYLFNINAYLPVYISIIIHFIIFIVSFNFYETDLKSEEQDKQNKKKLNMSSTMLLIILSNAIFYSVVKVGQSNSKLFMQYDFQEFLSTEMVTYYITVIVFISRIARIAGNVIFGKLYERIKDNMSNILTVLLAFAFVFLILGHYIQIKFIYKVIIMSLGFFIILAVRDSFQVYIEDLSLNLVNENEQQDIIVKIETSRKIGTLILSGAFTLILIKYELIVVEFILLVLSIIEILVNKKLYNKVIDIRKMDK